MFTRFRKRWMTTRFGSLAAMAALLAGCALSPEAKEARALDSGKKAMLAKDYRRAALYFSSAVKVKREDPEAYYQLALAYLAMGDQSSFDSALGALNKAIAVSNDSYAPARIKMTEIIAAYQGPGADKAHHDAEQKVREVLQKSPGNVDALNALALVEWKLDKRQDAELDLLRVLGQAPQNLQAALNLARAKYLDKDMKGAEDALKKAVAANPKSAAPELALGEFYFATGKPGVEAAFLKAMELDPTNELPLLNLGYLYQTSGRMADAEKIYKKLSDFPKFKDWHAKFLFASPATRGQAVAEFETLAKSEPSNREARDHLIEAYFAVGRAADAGKVIDEALRKNPKDTEALLQRTRVDLAERKLTEARREVTEVLSRQPINAKAHYLRGKIDGATGAVLREQDELTKAVALDGGMFSVRLELAQLLIRTGGATGAKAALDLMNQDYTQKKTLAAEIQRNWARYAAGDLVEMRKGIDRCLDLAKTQKLPVEKAPELMVQDGLWKLRSAKAKEAATSFEEVLKDDPANMQALEGLTAAYAAQGRTGEAVAMLKQYAAKSPQSAPVQQFLGSTLLSAGDRAGARVALNQSVAADPEYIPAYLSLAQVEALERKWDAARADLSRVLAFDSRNSQALLWMGIIEEANGNNPSAIEKYRAAIDSDPNNARALNNLAYLLADQKPDDALKYAEKARELNPNSGSVEDTLGWVLYRKGLYPVALRHLELAAAQRGGMVVWKYHLAMAYAKAGDAKKGRETLDAALKLNPNIPEAKMAKEVVGQAR